MSARARGSATQRERVIAPSRSRSARRDLDDLLKVAVEETARAAGVDRCFIRLGARRPGPVVTEWSAAKLGRLDTATRLPVAHLALRDRRTVSFADVLDAPTWQIRRSVGSTSSPRAACEPRSRPPSSRSDA